MHTIPITLSSLIIPSINQSGRLLGSSKKKASFCKKKVQYHVYLLRLHQKIDRFYGKLIWNRTYMSFQYVCLLRMCYKTLMMISNTAVELGHQSHVNQHLVLFCPLLGKSLCLNPKTLDRNHKHMKIDLSPIRDMHIEVACCRNLVIRNQKSSFRYREILLLTY